MNNMQCNIVIKIDNQVIGVVPASVSISSIVKSENINMIDEMNNNSGRIKFDRIKIHESFSRSFV